MLKIMNKYTIKISDLVSELEGLNDKEVVKRLFLMKDCLKYDWNNCPAEDLPTVDILIEFIELAIHHINTKDMDFPDDCPLHDELARLCRSVKINAD